MLLQLGADEFDVIVCGSVACSREACERDDYMSRRGRRKGEMNVEGKGAERELTREKGRIAADRVRERWAKEGRRSRGSQNSTVTLLLLFLVRKTFLVKCLIERIWMHASKRGFFSFSCHSAFKIVFVSERLCRDLFPRVTADPSCHDPLGHAAVTGANQPVTCTTAGNHIFYPPTHPSIHRFFPYFPLRLPPCLCSSIYGRPSFVFRQCIVY